MDDGCDSFGADDDGAGPGAVLFRHGAQSLAAVAIISILWVAFGYSLAFVGDGPWLVRWITGFSPA
jgi:hypothetical protein